MVLPIVDEIAHVDEEIGAWIALCCILRKILPIRVVARLGIREDERLESFTGIGMK